MTIYHIADLLDTDDDLPDGEITVRVRVQSTAIEGETEGLEALYLVEDPRNDIQEYAALSFWTDGSAVPGLGPTDPAVLAAVDVTSDSESSPVSVNEIQGSELSRGEEVLARAIPKYGDFEGEERLYLNVTGFLIRDPSTGIGKGYLRSTENCPRESHLRYTKQVYQNDPYELEHGRESTTLRGDVAHRATERALEDHRQRFNADEWTEETTREFCQSILEEEFSIRQAMLIISGMDMKVRDHVVDIVHRLFNDDRFTEAVLKADSVDVERYLDRRFGYHGRVDIVADGVPYDLKTTRNPDDDTIEGHAYQLKLYLFVLLLEQLDDGESVEEALNREPTGYLVYPNVEEEPVRLEAVELTDEDVATFLSERNATVTSGDEFAPPSTYNRDCEGCLFQNEEWISGPDDALPPACTYHCQNERRWPCYEVTDGEMTTDCSLFDTCDQRTEFRDPDRVDHYERLRAGLQEEREAREVATRVFNRLDSDLLAESGRRVPDLNLAGVSGGSVLRYESSNPVVPAFEEGDLVRIRPQGGEGGERAIYHGTDGNNYEFQFIKTGSPPRSVMDFDTRYEAVPLAETNRVDDQYLPYLDFAQRRGYPAARPRGDDASVDTDGVISADDTSEVVEYLDHDQVFVDLPVRENRLDDFSELIRQLVTADLPHPDDETLIPSSDTRALVLGTKPELVDAAHNGQPNGPHYRIDGTSHGEESIEASDGSHQVQQRLLSANSLVSSVSYATSDWPTKGHTELFHALTDGDFVDSAEDLPDRGHTDRFFDVLVLLGAEQITEPEYRFLQDVADRVVAVGDSRRRGPEMLSDDAAEANLDVSHFETMFDHFGSFPNERGVSLQVTGHATPALQQYYDGYSGELWAEIEGSINFLDVEGAEETSLEMISLQTTVSSAAGNGQRLVFDVTDTSANVLEMIDVFSERESLDHTKFTVQAPTVVEGHSLYLRDIETLPDGDSDQHEIVIRAEVAEVAQFGESLLTNRPAEQIVAQIVDEDVDLVVTPFERHATRIRRQLRDAGHETTQVKRPRDLNGEIADHAVISFGTSNEEGIVRPPVTDPDVLYGLLSCAREVTLVGNSYTLRSKDLFRTLLDVAEPYQEEVP